jgi:acyl dehydratase
VTGNPGILLGRRRGPFAGRLDADLLRRYAAATSDPSPAVQAGDSVPPVALVTQIWDAQNAGREASVPDEVQRSARSGVHGEHDIVVHRPIEPGEPLAIWVEGHGARPAGRNALVTLRYTAVDGRGAVVAEQWWTTVFLGTTCEVAGDPAPDHAFPDGARQRPVGSYTIEIDAGMPHRYAEVSGDWSRHHFEVEAARRSGADRPFLHGLCTMALCGQAVAQVVAGGDPSRIRRLAVRFATPAFVGERIDVRLYDAGELGFAFEATSAGASVISNGRAELH